MTETRLPVVLVNDGRIVNKNLKYLGYDRNWLINEFAKYGTKKHQAL